MTTVQDGRTLIVIPVLRRPRNVAPLVESIEANTPEPHRTLFVASPGDDDEYEAVRVAGAELLIISRPPTRGDWARKVNAAYRRSDEPFLFLGADDLRFHPGWLTAALSCLGPGIGVVGTNDLSSPRVMSGQHATHFLVTREYADRFGTLDGPRQVAVERYRHEYVDDELIGTARKRGAYAFAASSHVEHMHPAWGKAETDPLYDAQQARMRGDRMLFLRRRRQWT